MAYNRNRNYRRTSSAGSRWMNLRYAGTCKVCGQAIPTGQLAYWDAAARTVTCERIECAKADGLTEQQWHGSPVSGQYVDVLRERGRIGSPAPTSPRVITTRFNSGAVTYRNARGRCEDAPCCGCCS
jgi:hypothetical protein